MRKEHTH